VIKLRFGQQGSGGNIAVDMALTICKDRIDCAADAKNTETLVSSLKESIKGTQWMCGFPDTLIIYTVNDDYVVAAFGNKDAIASFKTKLATVYGESAALKVEEALV
jgi:hypothetical protein